MSQNPHVRKHIVRVNVPNLTLCLLFQNETLKTHMSQNPHVPKSFVRVNVSQMFSMEREKKKKKEKKHISVTV